MSAGEYKRSYGQRMRERIEGSVIIEKLIAFVTDEEYKGAKVTMNAQQVTAALSLVDRVLPKLSAQTLKVEDTRRPVREVKTEDLIREWDELRAARAEQATTRPN